MRHPPQHDRDDTSGGPHQQTDELARLDATNPVGNALLELPAEAATVHESLKRLVAIEFRTHATELIAYRTMLSRFPPTFPPPIRTSRCAA